jgi:hypothetical protein
LVARDSSAAPLPPLAGEVAERAGRFAEEEEGLGLALPAAVRADCPPGEEATPAEEDTAEESEGLSFEREKM